MQTEQIEGVGWSGAEQKQILRFVKHLGYDGGS